MFVVLTHSIEFTQSIFLANADKSTLYCTALHQFSFTCSYAKPSIFLSYFVSTLPKHIAITSLMLLSMFLHTWVSSISFIPLLFHPSFEHCQYFVMHIVFEEVWHFHGKRKSESNKVQTIKAKWFVVIFPLFTNSTHSLQPSQKVFRSELCWYIERVDCLSFELQWIIEAFGQILHWLRFTQH